MQVSVSLGSHRGRLMIPRSIVIARIEREVFVFTSAAIRVNTVSQPQRRSHTCSPSLKRDKAVLIHF